MYSMPASVRRTTTLASASVYRSSFILRIASSTAPPYRISVITYTWLSSSTT